MRSAVKKRGPFGKLLTGKRQKSEILSFSPRLGQKKGLSEIVANLLIILLVLVAIGIVWIVVRGVISKGASDVELSQFAFNLKIQSAYINGSNFVVTIQRNAGGGSDLTGVNLVFLNSTDSIVMKRSGTIQENGKKTFTFTSAELPGMKAGDKVSVAPLYTSSGSEKTGNPTDITIISGTPPIGGGGNGGNGGTGNPGTGSCGDSVIQSPNGNGINEQCDGNNLGSQSCSSLGLGTGPLSCTSGCQFDTLQCTGAGSSFCTGTWNQSAYQPGVYECDGNPLPNGCAMSCMCGPGFSPNGSGGCVLNPPINNGTIFSVWPQGAAKYFDSEQLPVDVSQYPNYYVNFSSPNENGCFRITFAEYQELNGRSYLRTEFVANISAGQNYYVWRAANCGQ